jgi:hypothetical protein
VKDGNETFQQKFVRHAGTRSDLELARMFKVSVPTIARWKAGTTSPHPLAREAVFKAFAKSQATFVVDRAWLKAEAKKALTSYFQPITWTYKQIRKLFGVKAS